MRAKYITFIVTLRITRPNKFDVVARLLTCVGRCLLLTTDQICFLFSFKHLLV